MEKVNMVKNYLRIRFYLIVLFILNLVGLLYSSIGLKPGFSIPPGIKDNVRTIVHNNLVYLWGMDNSTPSKFQEWVYDGSSWSMNYEMDQCPYSSWSNNVVVHFKNSLWFTGKSEGPLNDLTFEAIEYKNGTWTNHGYIWPSSTPFVYDSKSSSPCGSNETMWFFEGDTAENKLNLLYSCNGIDVYQHEQIDYIKKSGEHNCEHYQLAKNGDSLFVTFYDFVSGEWTGKFLYSVDFKNWLVKDEDFSGFYGIKAQIFSFKKKYYVLVSALFVYHSYIYYWDMEREKLKLDSKRDWKYYTYNYGGQNPTSIEFNNKTYIGPTMQYWGPDTNAYYHEIFNAYKIEGMVYGPNSNIDKGIVLINEDSLNCDTVNIIEGKFTFWAVAEGNYKIKIKDLSPYVYCPSKEINVEVTDRDVFVEFWQIDTSTLTFEYTPKTYGDTVLVGENISFSFEFGTIEPTLYEWNFGDKKSFSAFPEYKFNAEGDYNVTLKLTLCEGITTTISKTITAICPSPPPPPVAKMFVSSENYINEGDIVNGIREWNILDQCPIYSENVSVGADPVPAKCGNDEYLITEYKWFLNGIQKTGNTDSKTFNNITDGDTIQLTIEDENGNTASVTRRVRLIPCEPGVNMSSSLIFLKKDNKIVTGSSIIATLHPESTQIDVGSLVELDCICRINDTVLYQWNAYYEEDGEYKIIDSWTGPCNAGSEYGFITSEAWGKYKIELTVTVEGNDFMFPPREFNLVAPIKFVTCPKYGCGSTPDLCSELYDIINWKQLDPEADLYSGTYSSLVEAQGGGAANKQGYGFWDEGLFKSTKISNDFTFIVRVNNSSLTASDMEGGIMIRTSMMTFDRMLFIGLKDGKNIVVHRNKPRQDVGEFEILSGGSSYEWLKIVRIGDKIECFISTNGTTWDGPFGCQGITEFKGWDGTIEVGIFAAGDNNDLLYDTVSFSNIKIENNSGLLSKPNTVIKTIFSDGNLVSNWSFENIHEYMKKIGTGWNGEQHFQESQTEPAYEGRYYLRMENKPSGAAFITPEYSCYYEKGNHIAEQIKLAFMVRPSVNKKIQPVLVSYPRDGSSPKRDTLLSKNVTANIWNNYDLIIDMPDPVQYEYFAIEVLDKTTAASGIIDIDNLLITPLYGGENNSPVTTMVFADALEQEFQTITTTEDYDIVSAVVLDNEGRVYRNLPPYAAYESDGEFHKVKRDPVGGVRHYYQSKTDNRDWNYSELDNDHGRVIYENAPTGRVLRNDGRSNALDIEYEYTFDDYGVDDSLNHRSITKTMAGFAPNKSFYQIKTEYKNAYGYTVEEKQDFYGNSDSGLISTYDTDIFGRVWRTVSPQGQICDSTNPDCISPVTVIYDTKDNITESNDPDKGRIERLYDKLGNLRFFRDGNKRADDKFLVNCYDEFSRLNAIYIIRNTGGVHWNQANADNPSWPENVLNFEHWAKCMQRTFYDYSPPEEYLPPSVRQDDFENTVGKVTARFSYPVNGSKPVSSFFSYDNNGNVWKIWRSIPGLPLQKQEMSYSLDGKVVRKTIEGTIPNSNERYKKTEVLTYDYLGRLNKVSSLPNDAANNTEIVAKYEYTPDNKLRYKYMGDNKQRIKYVYDFADRLEKQLTQQHNPGNLNWENSGFYSQDIAYNYQGNISSQQYFLNNAIKPYRKFIYEYDSYNRLINADYGSGTGGFGFIGMDDDEFNERIAYNKDGAIIEMGRGSHAQEDTAKGIYSYYANSHRVKSISGLIAEGGKDRSHVNNYEFDENGNLILDKALKMRIEYDYRNLPVTVKTYQDNDMKIEKSVINYIYDAEGNRVLKTRQRN